mmetsp:Transcript_10923/g.13799  ORF Transcript_10923/g.13799 Transcript_10923/m.13799 type:complete len:148 (+) Transcript_10923:535-978(+)
MQCGSFEAKDAEKSKLIISAQAPPRKQQRCEFSDGLCVTRVYKQGLCKTHFLEHLQKELRTKVRRLYKDPENAFAAFNFRGQATIGMNDILNHRIMAQFAFAKADVKSYLLREKVFPSEKSEIDFTRFKKFFFPQLMLIEDGAEHEL